jgi:hypothetical protein
MPKEGKAKKTKISICHLKRSALDAKIDFELWQGAPDSMCICNISSKEGSLSLHQSEVSSFLSPLTLQQRKCTSTSLVH